MGANACAVAWPRLAALPLGARLGITCLLLVVLGGLVASARHVYNHFENRDEVRGMSANDLIGAYHGVTTVAPLLTALERSHPPELAEAQRTLLLKWVRSKRINEDYDSPEAGDPSGIIAAGCVACHARSATKGEGIGKRLPLENLEDIRKVAFSKDISPTPTNVVVASTHAHALSLGALTLVLSLLAMCTGVPRWLGGLGVLLAGAGLLADLGSWWLTRATADGVYVMIAAGMVYQAGLGLLVLIVLAELWVARRPG